MGVDHVMMGKNPRSEDHWGLLHAWAFRVKFNGALEMVTKSKPLLKLYAEPK